MYEKFIKSTNQVFFVVQCFLSYRVTFLCNGFAKLIIHQKALYDIFYEKTCKVVYLFIRISIIGRSHIFIFFKYPAKLGGTIVSNMLCNLINRHVCFYQILFGCSYPFQWYLDNFAYILNLEF